MLEGYESPRFSYRLRKRRTRCRRCNRQRRHSRLPEAGFQPAQVLPQPGQDRLHRPVAVAARTTSCARGRPTAPKASSRPRTWRISSRILQRRVIPHFLGKDARDLESLVDDVYIANYKLSGPGVLVPGGVRRAEPLRPDGQDRAQARGRIDGRRPAQGDSGAISRAPAATPRPKKKSMST